jgi:hypothetical protein
MDINYSPVPHVCKGIITSVIKDTETYEVSIYSSPIGPFSGPIYASATYPPGTDNNYKQGDYVHVQMMFNATQGKVKDLHPGSANYITGLFNERSIANIKIENPLTKTDNDRVVFKNKHSQAGMAVSNSGELVIASGAMYILLKAFGYGMYSNVHKVVAQNHHRIIGNAPPYLSREHFGLFAGNSDDDEISKTTPQDYFVTYRRFVTQTLAPDHWVSTCEGAYSPWVGPNNDTDSVNIGKQVLLSKIINHGDSRATIEVGEPGGSFINIRIDDAVVCEKRAPTGAVPAKLGNRFSLKISDAGAVEMIAAGHGLAQTAGFKLLIKEDGEVEIRSTKKITLTHGGASESNNSIILDPTKGIDVTANNGFRVNGEPILNKKFLDWMIKNQAAFVGPIVIGPLAPIHPAALPELNLGAQSIQSIGGFTTNNKGLPAIDVIKAPNDFDSVG